MPLNSLKRSNSLNRMKSGLKRFLDKVEDMREIMYEEDLDEEIVEYEEVEVDETEFEEDLPEAIVEDTQREEAILAEEQAQIAAWRIELERSLESRSERATYFKQYHSDSTERFQRMLRTAREQLEGAPPVETASEEPSEELNAPVAEIEEPEPEAIDNPDIELYLRPSLKLLEPADISKAILMTPEALEAQKNSLQEAMDSFAVDAYVYDAVVGPRVTQFRVQPGMGVRVEAISALQKNIALAMANTNIRIQAPIPGEPFVGIEVGNSNAVPILIRSMLESRAWHESEADIPLIMGMDIQGKIIITDLAKAPHLLIAGATGSGKSVCMSTLILSLLYKFRPDELELVLIAPKRVEFGLFKDVPHLIHSVVTEPKPAVSVLKWVVAEMERRYQVLAEKQ
ncbi:MAG: DNA translocase FtsK, partial [Coraliomargarita sp.]|nr:DNA translocase FtsK [Coraliomargarita sp.]